MTRLLHVVASPRGGQSTSGAVAQAFIQSWRLQQPDVEVDTLDLWHEDLPPFDGDKAAAKMSVITGSERDAQRQAAWWQITQVARRFTDADVYLFSVPMWNGGVPYRLKHYIDLLTQPGILYRFDPALGYRGMLEDRRAAVVYTSAVYQPGLPPAFGQDFQATYMAWWLRAIGITQVESIHCQPTLRSADPQRVVADAVAQAQAGALRLASLATPAPVAVSGR